MKNLEYEVEVKIIEEPIISEIIMPDEKPDDFIEFNDEMSRELGYKSLRYSVKAGNPRLVLKTIDDEEIVVPDEVVADKLKEILDKVANYEDK